MMQFCVQKDGCSGYAVEKQEGKVPYVRSHREKETILQKKLRNADSKRDDSGIGSLVRLWILFRTMQGVSTAGIRP